MNEKKLDLSKPSLTTGSQIKRSNAIRQKSSSLGQGQQKRSKQQQQQQSQTSTTPHSILFPIDYFEKCTQLMDVEYSGSPDLIEIYSSQQLKMRLTVNNASTFTSSNSAKFVVNTRPNGFRLDLTNNQPDSGNRLILMGCRLLVGVNSVDRAPKYVDILDRRVNIGKVSHAKWIDVCLTREEALICDNKISLLIGPSQLVEDKVAGGLTVLDGVMCYVRPKTDLGYSKTEVNTLQKK